MNLYLPQLRVDQSFPWFYVGLQQVLTQYLFPCFTAYFLGKPPSVIKIPYYCSLPNIEFKILSEFSNFPLHHIQTLHTSHHLIFYHFPTFIPASSLPLPEYICLLQQYAALWVHDSCLFVVNTKK